MSIEYLSFKDKVDRSTHATLEGCRCGLGVIDPTNHRGRYHIHTTSVNNYLPGPVSISQKNEMLMCLYVSCIVWADKIQHAILSPMVSLKSSNSSFLDGSPKGSTSYSISSC